MILITISLFGPAILWGSFRGTIWLLDKVMPDDRNDDAFASLPLDEYLE